MRFTSNILIAVFFLSGMDSLIYQVAWQRLLTVYYGVGPISTTLIVTIFMLGLGVGALCGGVLAERVRNRIRVYMTVELLLGCFGLVSLPYLDFLGASTAGSSYQSSFVWMFLFLCIPTLLMGMTLPLIVKIFSGWFPDFLDTVAYLYFINTLGAALGALVASYGIISFLGLDWCIYLGFAVNVILACLIYLAGRAAPGPSDAPETETLGPKRISGTVAVPETVDGMGRTAWLVVLVTGFLAIGYEILWFRMIEVLVKASPYAFSTVLAVYLSGIALGSFAMHRALHRYRIEDRRSLFFSLQFLCGAYVGLSSLGYYYLTRYTRLHMFTKVSFTEFLHPNFEFSPIRNLGQLFLRVDILAWPFFFMFVPTLLMGASFPLISFLAQSRTDQEGRTVGTVYFFNTLGNVLGGIVTGFILLPVLHTEFALITLVTLNILMGLFVARVLGRRLSIPRRLAVTMSLLAVVVVTFPRPGQLYAAMHSPLGHHDRTFQEEGIEGIVYTIQDGERISSYINGLSHGGRLDPKFYAEAVEALSFARDAQNILIIGFGTGSITVAVQKQSGVQRITLVELNDTLIRSLTHIPVIRAILADPRLDLIIDDGRRFLLRTDQRFDLVLIDPLRTMTAYSNNLYSQQFFTLVKQHLAPGGVFMAWMDEARVMPKTIHAVFPYIRCYRFYGTTGFCIASDSPLRTERAVRDRILATFTRDEQERINGLQIAYLGDGTYVEEVARDFPVNEDWRPVCEYYLGLKVRQKLNRAASH
jgi:predicted membrane-bound spermidine synthase